MAAPVVNLPGTIGGFTFNGFHSSEFGVRQTPGTRVLLPQKRRTILDIPGRSSSIVQEDGGYNARTESIQCSYVLREGESLQRQVRKIAGWLSVTGELSFDYEPEMKYMAFLSSAPPTVKMLEYATFELEFTIISPFAYEAEQQLKVNLTPLSNTFNATIGGTVKTPVKLQIRNTGGSPIRNIVITVSHTNNQ